MTEAIFLGTFNPPHIGHLNCIQSVLDDKISKEISRIHIIPCHQNPNKEQVIDYDIRFNMCSELFKGISDKVVIDDIERDHKWIFTYDMLECLYSGHYPYIHSDFLWIVTEETLKELFLGKWYKSEEIWQKHIHRMIILGKEKECQYSPDRTACKRYIQLHPGINVHSTQIRDLIKEGKNPILYMNQGVMDIIKENQLYTYNLF
jgi:nicotinate-nucleotide adenylyltransferase